MFYVGLDLGQSRDHSAIAVVERREALLVRHVERVTLGTSYPRVVSRVRDILRGGELRGRCSLTVDGTGVGAPVVEMLRGAQIGCEISAVTITGGERAHSIQGAGGEAWSVPKQDLIAGVQVLLERGELKIARKMRDTGPLVRELLDIRVSQGRGGRMRLGADRSGEHDDLVIALALACWRAGRKQLAFGSRRLPGI
jgi:hypothetical protein